MTSPLPGSGFLQGVRVLELCDELGEYCGKVLAGLGAEVLKVEAPHGEDTRRIGPFAGDDRGPDASLHFWHYNFGKRGVVVDLDTYSGRADFVELVRHADVLLDSRHRDYLPQRHLSYGPLSEINPGLVYARISAFGDDGPWGDYTGSDLVHLALGGVMMNCGYDPTPEGEYDTEPIAPQMWQAYHITGEVTAVHIIAALLYRRQSGVGQQVSTAVHDAVAKNTETDLPDWVYRRLPHSRLTGRHSFPTTKSTGVQDLPATPGQAMTKDGRWVLPYQTYLPGALPPAALTTFLKEHGFDLEPDDPDTGAVSLTKINDSVGRLLCAYRFERDLWLEAQRAGLPWAPIRKPEENVDDRHWQRRDTFFQVEHLNGHRYTHIGAKWFSPQVGWRHGPAAPRLGERDPEVDRIWAGPSSWNTACVEPADNADAPLSPLGAPWALHGVRVIDLGWILASAGAGRFLAALGAEVVKVEHRGKIDMMRLGGAMAPDGLRAARDVATAPVSAAPTTSLNRSGSFMENNAGKLAASLNLKSERGRELLKQLVRDADIIVEGYSPGTMDRLGLGYDVLREINPRIIYVQQSGMGQAGTYGGLKCFGPTAQAMSGLTEMSGLPEPFPPAGIGYSYLDWFGAYQMALAMVAALFRQRRTGEGCWIDSSQVEAGIYLSGTAVLDRSVNRRSWSRSGNRSPYKPASPHGVFRTAGPDRWIALAAFDDAQWHAVAEVLGVADLADDPRFVSLEARIENQDELEDLLRPSIGGRDGVALMTALQARGVPAGVCATAEDRVDRDPQLAHLGWLVELPQSEIGRWRTKTPPSRLSVTPAYQGGIRDRHAPCYGEDNDYVYRELLGLDDETVRLLGEDGVI
jgi:crotonobetainyl-CoA:carnitine CoA-transferase CaiB-like acyl-CoA transferase